MNYQFNKEIYYDYGKYINLNGIDPQEIVENIQNAGSRKNKVTINCVVQEGEDKQWYLVFTPSATINDILNIKFIVSNENGRIEDQIEIKPTDTEITYHSPVYKYCTVTFPKTQYTSKTTRYYTNFINPNGNGIFEVNLLKYKDNKEHNTDLNQFKYNTEVVLPIEIIEGCDFVNWEINIGENTETGNTSEITFMMPEDNVTIKCYYNIQKFTITWQNENGEILEVDNNVHYGNIPSYNGETPTKEETEEFTYTFNSWSPKITTATGNTTYVATYTSQKRVYTITWLNYNNELIDTTEVEYGVIPTHIEPEREATAQYTYTFKSWEPELSEVVGNVEYKASYNTVVNQYVIQWLDWDDKVLTATTVEYGTTPIYPNAEPTREATAQYTYTFKSWEPTVSEATTDTEYVAVYNSIENEYTVEWYNCDNTLITSETVKYGIMPTIPEDPTYEKPHYICDFIGWDKQVTIVTCDTQYIAQYSETPLQYTIIVNVENGTYDITPEKDSYTYGEKVVITINPFEGYNYEELTDEIDITGNMTLNYECTPNEYNLIIKNVSYGKKEYGSDISQYLTYEPQEGMIHKWMEGKTTFTGTTMPSRDLTLREVWVSASETNVVYYGGMIISDAKNITSEEVLNLQNFEYENGEVFNTTYVQATLNDETIWDTYPNRSDKTAWRNEHGSVLYIAIPKECNVEVKDDLGASYILEKQPNTLIIEGHEYDHYIDTPADPARPSSTPASLNIKITITK